MNIYSIPENTTCLIFDIDSTLYTHPEYASEQVDIQIRHFAALRGMSADEARSVIAENRAKWKELHGSNPSLGNTLTLLGIPISESIRWREELLEPSHFLSEDPILQDTMKCLATHYRLVAVTNNPVKPARKTLRALGIESFFPALVALDTTGVSKPHTEPFLRATQIADTPAANCISIGDRYDIDIALPLQMGMGGILVNGVEDVYTLPDVFRLRS